MPEYRTRTMRGTVLIEIPAGELKKYEAHSFEVGGKKIKIPDHHRNGMPVDGRFLNMIFYGLSPEDFGKRIVAKVEVVEKTTKDGKRTFTMLNVYKHPNGAKPTHGIEFLAEGDKASKGGYLIQGTHTKICFPRYPGAKS